MFIEPVFGERFFGREEIIAVLRKRASGLKGGYRQNLALTGPMLAGKSSILRQFLLELEDRDIIPLYIDMNDDDLHHFCVRFMSTLLFRFLVSTGQESPAELSLMEDKCREQIPLTAAAIARVRKYLAGRRYDRAYEMLLSLPAVLREETGKSCIVILDEFHNLASFGLKKPFQIFGKYIMVQKNTMYIVTSSQKTMLKEILSRKLSLLFGNFEVLDVEGFDYQTSKAYISRRMPSSGEQGEVLSYIIQLSRGNPFYLELLSSRFSELSEEAARARPPKEVLLDVLAELLYQSDGLLYQFFNNNMNFFLEKKSRKRYIPVLVSLAEGNATMKAVQAARGKADKELGAKLRKLQSMDMIYNSGLFYRISDKLFEFWLKYVYKLRSRVMVDDMDIRYLEFKKLVECDLEAYRSFRAKDVSDIICDLFMSFRNEKLRINIKDRQMPRFDSVVRTGEHGNVEEVIASFGDRKWAVNVKYRDITDENDILELASMPAPGGRGKIARKIFIALKGVEQNAFLLAKENNIWVWDLRQLNDILRLYGKHELVL